MYSQSQKWKPGDWKCGACAAHNFASRHACFRCFVSKEEAGIDLDPRFQSAGSHSQGWKPGDWTCDNCSGHNFAIRQICFQCGMSKEASKDQVDTQVKKALVMDYVTRLQSKYKRMFSERGSAVAAKVKDKKPGCKSKSKSVVTEQAKDTKSKSVMTERKKESSNTTKDIRPRVQKRPLDTSPPPPGLLSPKLLSMIEKPQANSKPAEAPRKRPKLTAVEPPKSIKTTKEIPRPPPGLVGPNPKQSSENSILSYNHTVPSSLVLQPHSILPNILAPFILPMDTSYTSPNQQCYSPRGTKENRRDGYISDYERQQQMQTASKGNYILKPFQPLAAQNAHCTTQVYSLAYFCVEPRIFQENRGKLLLQEVSRTAVNNFTAVPQSARVETGRSRSQSFERRIPAIIPMQLL